MVAELSLSVCMLLITQECFCRTRWGKRCVGWFNNDIISCEGHCCHWHNEIHGRSVRFVPLLLNIVPFSSLDQDVLLHNINISIFISWALNNLCFYWLFFLGIISFKLVNKCKLCHESTNIDAINVNSSSPAKYQPGSGEFMLISFMQQKKQKAPGRS